MTRVGPDAAQVWIGGIDLGQRGTLTRYETNEEADYEENRTYGSRYTSEEPIGRSIYTLGVGGYFEDTEGIRRIANQKGDLLTAECLWNGAGNPITVAQYMRIKNRALAAPNNGLMRAELNLCNDSFGLYRTDAKIIHMGPVTGPGQTAWVDIGAATTAQMIMMIDGGDGYNSTGQVELRARHNTTNSGAGAAISQFVLDMAAGTDSVSALRTRNATTNRYIRVSWSWTPAPAEPETVHILAAFIAD